MSARAESPFQKRVLVPFWVVRILFMIIAIISYIVLLAWIGTVKSAAESAGVTDSAYGAAIGILVVAMLIMMALLIVDIVCIVKYHKRTLTPKFFLICNVVQTLFILITFILSLVGQRSAASIAVTVIVFLAFLGLLIYAGIIFHKYRTGTLNNKPYTAALNPSNPADAAHLEAGTTHQAGMYAPEQAYAPYNDAQKPYGHSSTPHQQAPYQPPHQETAYPQEYSGSYYAPQTAVSHESHEMSAHRAH